MLTGICKRQSGSVLDLNIPPIRLAEGTLCLIVDQEQFDDFVVAIKLVEEIYNGCGQVVPFKLFAKLSSGLKMKVSVTVCLLCLLMCRHLPFTVNIFWSPFSAWKGGF